MDPAPEAFNIISKARTFFPPPEDDFVRLPQDFVGGGMRRSAPQSPHSAYNAAK